MGLFRQRQPQREVATAGVAEAAPQLPIGHLPCTQPGCLNDEGLECVYVDRRGRHCDTAWCRDHVVGVDGRPYCRRHAGVVRALPDVEPGSLPDLDNRAPSLLDWVTQRVDADITDAVAALAIDPQKVQTDTAHLVLITQNAERIRAWERTWKLYDHTGIHLWVALDVEEDNDLELVIRVNATTIERLVPPWITARRRGLRLSDEADAQQRAAFYALVIAVVKQNLALLPTT
ncbi:MAG TPA: hypothetical protein VI316_01890 [Candidatus Dormibacteraeota bacterium]